MILGILCLELFLIDWLSKGDLSSLSSVKWVLALSGGSARKSSLTWCGDSAKLLGTLLVSLKHRVFRRERHVVRRIVEARFHDRAETLSSVDC